MDDKKKNSGVENDSKYQYIKHNKNDHHIEDVDDTQYYYCKYCKKRMKIRYMTRHENSDWHRWKMMFYKEENLCNQIYNRLEEDFEAGHYDPNDMNLVGEERIERFKQLEKETWQKYRKATIDGYFDKLHFDEDIDFVDNFYHKMGIKLNARKEVFSDDSDSDDSKPDYSDDYNSDDDLIDYDIPYNLTFW